MQHGVRHPEANPAKTAPCSSGFHRRTWTSFRPYSTHGDSAIARLGSGTNRGYSYGHYGSIDHELLIVAGRGKATPTCDPKVTTKVSSVQSIPKSRHSAKPVEYYGIIERLYPDRRYLELFARAKEPRKRWTYWGNEL